MGAINSSVSTSNPLPTSLSNGSYYNVDVTVQDSSSNAVTGLTQSDFSLAIGSQTIQPTAAVYIGSGQYQLTFTPTTLTAGSSLLETLSVSGVAIGSTSGVSISSGSVSQGKSTAVFPTSSVLNPSATYTYPIELTLMDASGNPVKTDAGLTPIVQLGSGSSAVTLTASSLAVTPNSANGNDYYTNVTIPTTLTSAISTAVPLSITVGGTTFTSTTKYTVPLNANALTAQAINVDVSSLPTSLRSGATYTVPVTVTDGNGNVVPEATPTFTVSYQGTTISGAPVVSVAPATDSQGVTEPGVFNVSFTVPSSLSTSAVSALTFNDTTDTLTSATSTKFGYTNGISAGSSTVSWPSNASLTIGQNYNATVTVLDSNGSAVTGLTMSNFSTYDTTSHSTSEYTINSVTAGSTAGTYTVNFTPTSVAIGTTVEMDVLGTPITSSTFKPTIYGNSINTVAPNAASTLNSSDVLLAGSTVTVPFDITANGANGGVVPGLGIGDFTLKIGTTPISISSVTDITQSGATMSTYNVTFTVPSTTMAATQLSLSVDGTAATGLPSVSIASSDAVATATTPLGTSGKWTAAPTDVTLPDGTTLTAIADPTGGALSPSTSYLLTTVQAQDTTPDGIVGLTASDFKVTYGAGTANLVSNVVSYGDTYYVVITTPSTLSQTAQGFNLSVGADANVAESTATNYTIAGSQPSSFNSNISWPAVNSFGNLVAGQTDQITATLATASGTPMTGLTSSNFALGISTNTNGSSATAFTGNLTVTAGANPGEYNISFEPLKTEAAGSYYLALTVDANATAAVPAVLNAGTATTFASSKVSAVTAAPLQVQVSSFTAGTYLTTDADATATVTVLDASGNPVTGLTYSDFAVASAASATPASTTFTGVAATPATAATDFTVAAGASAGQYTLTVYNSTSTALAGGVTVTVNQAATSTVAAGAGTGSGTL